MHLWDMRPPANHIWAKKPRNPLAPVETFLYIKNTWTPFFSVQVEDLDPELDDLAEPLGALREKPRDFFHVLHSFVLLESTSSEHESEFGETEVYSFSLRVPKNLR